jgi:hypothetical protein
LEILEKQGAYKADISRVCDIRKAAYDLMMQTYGYDSCPIFLAPVNQKVEFYGADFSEEHVAMELKIPLNVIRIQKYYEWSDLIYFLEYPEEFFPSAYQNISDFGKDVLLGTKEMNERGPYQISTDIIRKDWITDTVTDLEQLKLLHYGSGGNNVLRD